MDFIKRIIRGYQLSFDAYGQDTKLDYALFAAFQILWYSLYFFALSKDSLSILLTLVFIVPLISSSIRCLNYLGRSRIIAILWLLAPYLMVMIPLFLRKKV